MKLWPFRTKQAHTPVAGTKSATFMFGMGSMRVMQQSFNALALEGYAGNPIVYGCVEKVATPLTAIDIQAYVPDKKTGKLKKVDNHPILKLLNKPNPSMTKGEFLGELARDFLIGGNAYAYGVGIDASQFKPKPPVELYIFKPSSMKVIVGDKILPTAYEHTIKSGQKETFTVNQITGLSAVMHKKSYNPIDQHLGIAPMMASAYGIDIINEGMRWNLRLLQNEGRPSGALTVKGGDGKPLTLSEEQYKRVQEQLEQQFTGSNNAGKPLLLEGGLEWVEMSMSAKDMDHEANMNKAARDIALVYGVPAQLLGIPGDTTYSNVAEAKLSLMTDTVLPLLNSLLESINNWLAPMYGDGVVLWYDEEMIPALEPLRKSKADRIEASTSLTTNEKRIAMGYPVLAGGDSVLVDSSKIPLELVGDMGLSESGSASDTGNTQ